MRLGLISDIHGNRLALEAVVTDGREQGIDAWWVLGDTAAVGPEPVATFEMLANLPGVRFVRGNTDRYVVTGARPKPYMEDVERDPSLRELFERVEAAFSWTRDQMASAHLIDELAQLPDEQRIVLSDGTRLLGIHASPRSDDGPGIQPQCSDAELAELLRGAEADIVCGGHTHRATDRVVDGTRAVNLGSVSNPMTEDLRASYVVVDDDRHGHSLGHRRVAYDHAAVIERIMASGYPDASWLAGFQRGARR